jgi:pimeloyl-ACP methyl ester carboxylesterase
MPIIQTNGIELYYEEQGKGEPLLLIMGITATGSVWEKHASYWSNDFRCITADNRGVGESGIPEGPYSTEQMADDYAALLESLNIDKVTVIGVSMGSTIAQQLAIRYPAKVKALVLMCPWARCDNTAKAIFQHMAHCKAALPPDQFALFIQLLIFSKASWDDQVKSAEMEEDRKKAAVEPQQPLRGLQAQAAACINHHVLNELPKIQQPVLVIGGKEDIFTPAWMAEEVAGAIPNAELHLYEGAGHAFHWEQIEDFNPRIKNWLLSNQSNTL